ncbi:MAG: endonuclease/exonuclease/phosphatase family protein, partial [Bacteroidales bacterium]
MHKIIQYIFHLIHLALTASLLLSCLSVYISPAFFWLLPIFSIAFVPLMLLNIACIGICLFFFSKNYLIITPSILVVVFSLMLSQSLVRLPCLSSKNEEHYDTILPHKKILSYNINLFGLNRSHRDTTSLYKIATFIRAEKFDMVCLQEFYTHDDLLPEDLIAQQLSAQLPHKHICYNVHRNKHKYGIATFSKYPIIGEGCINFEDSNNLAIFS